MKYKNENCKFHFGKFFTDRTIIAQPLSDSLSVDEKNEITQNWKLLLKKVREYIDTESNPSQKTFAPRVTMNKLGQLMKSWNF